MKHYYIFTKTYDFGKQRKDGSLSYKNFRRVRNIQGVDRIVRFLFQATDTTEVDVEYWDGDDFLKSWEYKK